MSLSDTQILNFLKNYPIAHHPGDFHSLIHMLQDTYLEHNTIDNKQTAAYFRSVDFILQKLPFSEHEQIFSIVADLCIAYETEAFSHGLAVGIRLMREIETISQST